MRIARFTRRQICAISVTVVLTLLTNLVIPGFAAAGDPDLFSKRTDPILISCYNGFDGCESESDPGQTNRYDNRDNIEPNSDGFDDFVLSGMVFSSERGACFGSCSTKAYAGRNPAPEHRPPDRA